MSNSLVLYISASLLAMCASAASAQDATTIITIDTILAANAIDAPLLLASINGHAGTDGSTASTPGIQPSSAVSTSKWTISGSLDLVSGRVFQEQGTVYTTKVVNIGDVTFCKSGTCIDLWAAESPIGRWQDREEDFTVWHTFGLGKGFTLQANSAYFEFVGKGDYRERLILSHSLGKNWTVNAYADLLRGGFNSQVYKGELVGNMALTSKLAFSPKFQVSYDDHFGRLNFGYDAGISYHFTSHLDLRPYTKGYQVLSNGKNFPYENARVYGLSFMVH